MKTPKPKAVTDEPTVNNNVNDVWTTADTELLTRYPQDVHRIITDLLTKPTVMVDRWKQLGIRDAKRPLCTPEVLMQVRSLRSSLLRKDLSLEGAACALAYIRQTRAWRKRTERKAAAEAARRSRRAKVEPEQPRT
jgi:hypothetical protein